MPTLIPHATRHPKSTPLNLLAKFASGASLSRLPGRSFNSPRIVIIERNPRCKKEEVSVFVKFQGQSKGVEERRWWTQDVVIQDDVYV